MTSPPRRANSPADPYDVKGEWVRYDMLALVPPTPTRVLSIGCGTGATETTLQQSGSEVFGIDVSVDAITVAQTRLHCALVADIEVDPLPELAPSSFDVVLCGDVLEHFRFTEHVLDRVHSWLRPGGALIASVPNATHHRVVRELVLHRNWLYEDAGLFDRGHYRLFTKKSLLRLLDQHGFDVEIVTFIRPITRKMRFVWWALKPIVWLLPFLNDYFVQTWTVRARARAPSVERAGIRAIR